MNWVNQSNIKCIKLCITEDGERTLCGEGIKNKIIYEPFKIKQKEGRFDCSECFKIAKRKVKK